MLYLFIYLAIGGILMSGMLIGKADTIFTAKLKKDLTTKFDDAERIAFGIIMSFMFIVTWLPIVIFCIVKALKK